MSAPISIATREDRLWQQYRVGMLTFLREVGSRDGAAFVADLETGFRAAPDRDLSPARVMPPRKQGCF